MLNYCSHHQQHAQREVSEKDRHLLTILGTWFQYANSDMAKVNSAQDLQGYLLRSFFHLITPSFTFRFRPLPIMSLCRASLSESCWSCPIWFVSEDNVRYTAACHRFARAALRSAGSLRRTQN